jgi:hypothetical protein
MVQVVPSKKKCKKIPMKSFKCALKKNVTKKRFQKEIPQVCPKSKKNCPKENSNLISLPYFHHWSPISRFVLVGAG